MNDKRKQPPNDQDLVRQIRDLPAADADPAFRAKLRDDFVHGRLAAAPAREISVRHWWHWAAPVAAAAVLLLMFAWANRGPGIQILAVSGEGVARIDGEPVALSDRDALQNRLRAGALVETPPNAMVDLVAEDLLVYEVTGGTKLVIPETPGRWFGRAVSCSLYFGELRLKTEPRFAGSELRVFTPDGMVVVTGTLLSIQCDDGGTCVCVLEGHARVGVDEADLEQVTPGFRKIMLRDSTKDIIPVKPMHRDGVLDFDRRRSELLKNAD